MWLIAKQIIRDRQDLFFDHVKGQAEGGEEVKKAEAAAKARTGRSSRWRPSSGTARALRAARRPRALVVVREPRLHLRTDSREATPPNRLEGGDLAQQRGKKRKSLATGRI